MNWKTQDTTPHWLKVRNHTTRAYFIPWEQDPAFLAINLLRVVPADAAESVELKVPLAAGELPWLVRDEIVTPVIRDADLVALWRKERRALEASGDIDPLDGAWVDEPSRPVAYIDTKEEARCADG